MGHSQKHVYLPQRILEAHPLPQYVRCLNTLTIIRNTFFPFPLRMVEIFSPWGEQPNELAVLFQENCLVSNSSGQMVSDSSGQIV